MIPLPPTPPSPATLPDWCRKVAGLINQLIATSGGGGGSGTVTSVGLSAPAGFSVSGSPVTTSGTLSITYSAGFQGYTSAEASKLAGIAPGATANTGTVTSVALSGGTTGLTASGSPVTTSGTFTLSGTLTVANGGTGATTLTGYVKGNGTSAFTSSASIPGTDVTGAALTRTNDTNVTLTLGGTPTTALLAATSMTLGWTGTLSAARGGTGNGAYVVGDILQATTTTALSRLAAVATGNVLLSGGVGAVSSWGKVGLTTHVSGVLPIANGGGLSGTWTPTLTGVVNVASSSTFTGQYMRVGNTVTASVLINVTPTTGSSLVAIGITLPVASAFTGNSQCVGSGSVNSSASGYGPGAIYADATNDRAELAFYVPSNTARDVSVSFTYQVI